MQGWDSGRIRTSGDAQSVLDGCWFDEEAGRDAVDFIERFCRHSIGLWSQQPFILAPWERDDIVLPLFGWKRPDGTRRFRTAYIEIPRKNGKSTLAAAIALYLLAGDGEMRARVVGAALNAEQAREVFDEANNMVLLSADLSRVLKSFAKTITFERTRSSYKILTKGAEGKHGQNISGIIFDEVHVQPDSSMWDVLTTGVGTRSQPLTFAITTSGDNIDSVAWDLHELARRMSDGTVHVESQFNYIRGAEPCDTWWRVETWIKANPGLNLDHWIEYTKPKRGKKDQGTPVRLSGRCPWKPKATRPAAYLREFRRFLRGHPLPPSSPQIEYLIDQAEKAVDSTRARAVFLWLHLNYWCQGTVRWLPMDSWDACACDVDVEELKGRRCYLGLDLASTIDLTALVALFPPDDRGGVWTMLEWFWMPEAMVSLRTKTDEVPYERWVKEGWITAPPGDTTDYSWVAGLMDQICHDYDVQEIAYDPYNAQQIVNELQGRGITQFVMMPQFIKYLNVGTKEFESAVVREKLRHRGNPVMRQHAENVKVRIDFNGNAKPDKGASKRKIDGIVAAVMPMGCAQLRGFGEAYGTMDVTVVDVGRRN